MICLVKEFAVVMTVMSVNVALWFRMSEMIVMSILVDMVTEMNFHMDRTVKWDFQMSVDECDGISSILWLVSGSSDDSESVSYTCSSFLADTYWLLNG